VEALQQDMKVASNRLRAEVAAAKHETMELSELRSDVEKSLRQLRLDIETAAAAKSQPLSQLRAEVDVCNKTLARLENEVQRLGCFKAELEASLLRNARAASAEKQHTSRNSTAPPKKKQNPHVATEALLQNEEGIARDAEIDPAIVGREVAELKIQLNDVCDVNRTNALLFRDLRARLVIPIYHSLSHPPPPPPTHTIV
jgi:hypothetical protein